MWKITRTFILTGTLLALFAIPAHSQTTSYPSVDQLMARAQTLVERKMLSDALIKLDEASPEDQRTYEYRFLKARILTWSGHYDRASETFQTLLAEFPNNYDVMVSYGYLEFFRGNLGSAESYFNDVIAVSPAYLDAYEGLRRVYELRNSSRTVSYTTLSQSVSCKIGQVLTSDGACTSAP